MIIKAYKSSNKIGLFGIKFIFGFLTFYFIVIPFLFDFSIENAFAVGVACIGFISFYLGFASRKKLHLDEMGVRNSLLIFLIATFFILNDSLIGFVGIMASQSFIGYENLFIIHNHSSLYIKILSLILFYFKYFIFSIFIKNKSTFFLVFISQALFYVASPVRLVVLMPFIIFIIFGYYRGYIKIGFYKITLSIIVAPLLFVIMLLRRGEFDGLNLHQTLLQVFRNLDEESFSKSLKIAMESFQSFEYYSQIIANNFMHLESGFFRFIFLPIPRDIWIDKPESVSRIISKTFNLQQYIDGGGSVATIYGDAFISGNIFGVIIFLFIIGYISKIIQNTTLSNLTSVCGQKSSLIMFYALFVYEFINFFRGFASERFWHVVIMLITFYMFRKLFLKVENDR